MLGHRELEVGVEVGGPDRVSLGHAGRVATWSKGFFGQKMREKGKRVAGLFFQFFKQRFDFKSKGFKYF
jgi:hypothetical protein